jgi:hypothetical protein
MERWRVSLLIGSSRGQHEPNWMNSSLLVRNSNNDALVDRVLFISLKHSPLVELLLAWSTGAMMTIFQKINFNSLGAEVFIKLSEHTRLLRHFFVISNSFIKKSWSQRRRLFWILKRAPGWHVTHAAIQSESSRPLTAARHGRPKHWTIQVADYTLYVSLFAWDGSSVIQSWEVKTKRNFIMPSCSLRHSSWPFIPFYLPALISDCTRKNTPPSSERQRSATLCEIVI